MFRRSFCKGQIFSQDALFAFILLFFLLSGIFITIEKVRYKIISASSEGEMASAADGALSALLSSGVPSNWKTIEGASALGLTSSAYVIDEKKADVFFSSARSREGYEKIRGALGLARAAQGIETGSYEFDASIYSESGARLYSTETAPRASTSAVARESKAVLNGSIVSVRLIVWVKR